MTLDAPLAAFLPGIAQAGGLAPFASEFIDWVGRRGGTLSVLSAGRQIFTTGGLRGARSGGFSALLLPQINSPSRKRRATDPPAGLPPAQRPRLEDLEQLPDVRVVITIPTVSHRGPGEDRMFT